MAARIWKEIKKAMAALPTFPAFDLQGDLSQGWRKYVSRFENLLLAMNITNAIRKKAMLLHYVGEEVNEIFDTLDVPEATEEEDVFRKAEKALREYSTPQKNIEFEVYKFRQAKQLSREISAYHTKLKQLAKSCDFYDEKRKIKTQIIQNGISSKLRRKALADPGITLEKILQIAKAMELSEVQVDGIRNVAFVVINTFLAKSTVLPMGSNVEHAINLIISGPVAKISEKSRSETRTGERNQLPRSEIKQPINIYSLETLPLSKQLKYRIITSW